MNKIEVVEELLPGFQQFLSDLATCRLTSALEAQVNIYNQNIEDYISQNFSVPKSLPPEPPTAVNGVKAKKTDDFIAEQRELSRMSQVQTVSNESSVKDDSYYNVSVGPSKTEAGFDNFYENPTGQKIPPVPSTSRPNIRNIQDDPLVYEEPDPVPAKVTSKASTMPAMSRQTGVEREASDSGGTFVSFHSSSSSQQYDDLDTYEDVDDKDNYDSDDSLTSYDSYDEEEIERHKNTTMDSNANKTKPKVEEKTDRDKLAIFRKRFEGDADQMGLLHICKKGMTISKKSFGAWNKRYCVARDMRLQCFKKCDSKQPAQELLLLGNTVAYLGQEGKQSNVLSISHPSRGTEFFSAESKEEANKWVEVLKGYATMGNELVPSTGFVGEESSPTMTNTTDDITKKLMKIFKREKKTVGQQLSMDDKGVVSGFINVLGAKYSDSKWRKRFVTVEEGTMALYSEDGDSLQFEFPLLGTEMSPADPKLTRRKMAMRIFRGAETLIYIQFFNHLDMGPLLQVYTKILDPKRGTSSPRQQGMVSNILRAFEKQNSDSGDQGVYDDIDFKNDGRRLQSQASYENFSYINVAKTIDEDLYLELLDDRARPSSPENLKPEKKKKKRAFLVMQHGRTRSASVQDSPGPVKKAEELDPDVGKKDKKTKKDKKDKKDKKGKGSKEQEAAAKEAPEVAVEPVRRRQPSVINKFKESDKSHLLVVDKLEVERKEVDERKRAVTKMKVDLSAQKRGTTDPRRKEQLDSELNLVQQEWSECSNRLAFINNEIERLTKGSDAGGTVEQKQDTASAEMVRNSLADPSKKEAKRATSPGRQVVQKSVGNVQDKLKMFQGMGNK